MHYILSKEKCSLQNQVSRGIANTAIVCTVGIAISDYSIHQAQEVIFKMENQSKNMKN